jgi:hypothetical protein
MSEQLGFVKRHVCKCSRQVIALVGDRYRRIKAGKSQIRRQMIVGVMAREIGGQGKAY